MCLGGAREGKRARVTMLARASGFTLSAADRERLLEFPLMCDNGRTCACAFTGGASPLREPERDGGTRAPRLERSPRR